MTRYAMVVDLRRCVGCQTCTAACKHANGTPPGVQWRKVLDFETGEYPDVRRTFVPVGCQHCSKPACKEVCPTGATQQRDNGIIAIDYDRCIGCGYCAVSCPFQARFKVTKPTQAYPKGRMANEEVLADPQRIGVAQKCTFCEGRVTAGVAKGLIPGQDPEATPACANACITNALHFGDLDDPDSNVAQLLQEHKIFRMHEELGTEPNFYYIWEEK